MFTVYDKENKEVKVYDVQRDKCGYPQFLIRHGNQWLYRSAKYYSTEQKRDKDAIKKVLCPHEYIYSNLSEKQRECRHCGKQQVLFYGTWCDR